MTRSPWHHDSRIRLSEQQTAKLFLERHGCCRECGRKLGPSDNWIVEHIIALVENDVGGTIVDAAKHAALTLGFLERHKELTDMLRRLHAEAPEVFKALSEITKAFPGASIADVRRVA